MNNEVAFLTTIFPMKEKYIYDFLTSLQEQIYKKFDLIVVNDGYKDFNKFIKAFKGLNIIELPYSSTPAKNREYGINYVKNHKYNILIFGDSDDYFENNRVQVCIYMLKCYDIVVNDLTLFTDEQGILYKNYISNRISENSKIELEFIIDKNIFGLSNTAVNVSILENISFDKDIIAVDWYLFTLLLLRGQHAIFTNRTTTYYRQHIDNITGLGSNTSETCLKRRLIKKKHYKLLQKEDNVFKKMYKDILKLENKMDSSRDSVKNIATPLWWEDV